MASVNGITLKGLKTFKDHEGAEIFQGNLYIGGKKIGFWSQDAWCGPDIVILDEKYDRRKLEECFIRAGYEDLERAMWKLLELKLDEEDWKKSGCDRLFIGTDGYHIINIQVNDPGATENDILCREDVINMIDHYFFEDGDYEFRIVDKYSFDIGDPIVIDEIRR